jgi:hypothetical protein
MAVTAKWYTNGPKHMCSDVVWTSSTIKVLLTTSSYTPDQDAHEFKSSVTNEVASGGGYTTGGVTLASKTTTADTASNETRLDAADISWTSATFTARYAVVYADTGVAGTSALLGYVDFGVDTSVSAGTFSITWDATGVLKITAS